MLMSQATIPAPRAAWLSWAPVAVGLSVLYVPTFLALAASTWESEDQGHGPIVLALVGYLFWQKRDALRSPHVGRYSVPGLILLLAGLALYVVGRSQAIVQFEVGSLLPVLLGTLLLTVGTSAVYRLAFPILFTCFLVPLPGILVTAITAPLKQGVSVAAEQFIYWLGYPIGRQGVTLVIGPYQLLVADACSGLNSIFSLTAIGLLYVYLMGHAHWQRNAILVASLVPLALAANVLRVVVLVLVTYHFGDAAGQGFTHGAAGMVLFVLALAMLFAADVLLGRVFPDATQRRRTAP
jgi:exosortase B